MELIDTHNVTCDKDDCIYAVDCPYYSRCGGDYPDLEVSWENGEIAIRCPDYERVSEGEGHEE